MDQDFTYESVRDGMLALISRVATDPEDREFGNLVGTIELAKQLRAIRQCDSTTALQKTRLEALAHCIANLSLVNIAETILEVAKKSK